ncbi:archease [Candidatus Pacearchaeota archaeon]|nr:archease [Candidatus Pacearchaeota archaeon]
MAKRFEFLEHTGDVKFRAYGRSLNELFGNCALAVSSVLSRGTKIKNVKSKKISFSGKDYESLLYQFIEELIYLFDAEGFVVSKADVLVDKFKIEAVIYGDKCSNYSDLDAIKSPTYAEMYVRQKGNMWECQVVLDV